MMHLWIAFISLLVKLAVWLKSYFRSILWKPQPEETRCVLEQVDGSAPHHGEDQLVQGTVVVDPLDSTSLTSHDALDFGLEPILSAISLDEQLRFVVSYESSGEVDKPSPNWRIWKTIVKSVSKDRNLRIEISRSGASHPTVQLTFNRNFSLRKKISITLMEEFANAIRSNQRIEEVRIESSIPKTEGIVTNMFQVMMESPRLQFVSLQDFGQGRLPLDRATVESLVSGLRRNLTLTYFSIYRRARVCFDTEGLKLFLKPLMIGGEGSYQGLKTLVLCGAGINNERAEVVASMLRHNTSLLHIDLYGNIIGPQGAARIAEALRSNTTLRTLVISGNPVGAAGLKALVASLTHNMADGDLQPNSFLTCLGIANDLGMQDMELLETLVRQNTSLLRLDLNLSSLLEVADNVIRFLEALKSNKCLEEVYLLGCSGVVGRRVLGTIFDLLEVNHRIKELGLINTPLERDGGAEMVKAVLEQKAKNNMWEVLQGMATARPNSARIFLCGYPFAGEFMNQFQEANSLYSQAKKL